VTFDGRESCCSVSPRLTMSDLVERGFRRNRAPPASVEGDPCADSEGNRARFSLDLEADTIVKVGFRASSCATLIGLCEYIAEVTPGLKLHDATALTPAELVAKVAGIPRLKHGRAAVAVAAFRTAIAEADVMGTIIPDRDVERVIADALCGDPQ
jgi:NifU-like N terminal domain